MVVSAQISIYPLRQERLTPAIQAVTTALAEHGLQPTVGPMSTVVAGDATVLFAALRDGFDRAAQLGHVVLTITVSTACPV
jgi:uncharacterized protein YqgV (UPF0045/DUF77 family)